MRSLGIAPVGPRPAPGGSGAAGRTHGACSACSRRRFSGSRFICHAPVRRLPGNGPSPGHRTLRQESAEVLGRRTILLPDATGTGIVDYKGGKEPSSQWRASFRFTGLEPGASYTVVIRGRFGARGSLEADGLHPVVLIPGRRDRGRAAASGTSAVWPGSSSSSCGPGTKTGPRCWGHADPAAPARSRQSPTASHRAVRSRPASNRFNRAVNRLAASSHTTGWDESGWRGRQGRDSRRERAAEHQIRSRDGASRCLARR